VLSILLFMVPFIWTGGERAFTQSPIGVLKGCRSYPERIGSTSISEVDDPLSCEIHGPQWLLNIGGTVTPLYQLFGQEERFTTELGRLVEAASTLLVSLIDRLADRLDEDGAGGTDAAAQLRPLREAVEQLRGEGDAAAALQALETWMEEAAEQGLPANQARRVYQDLVQLHEHIGQLGRTGCIVDASGSAGCGFAVKGGLVLPLYIVVFSLFGGAISMTRRLPEYQRRVTPAYWDAYAQELRWYPNLKPPISPEALREFVIFQIMQTLSAPLIAATVYSLLEPSNQSTVVVIGFAAGFASEPILLRLRKLADQLSGSMELSPIEGGGPHQEAREPPPAPAREAKSGPARAADRRSRSDGRRAVPATGRLARVRRERAMRSIADNGSRSSRPVPEDAPGSASERRAGGRPGGRRERVRRLLAGAGAGTDQI
jgi:hypothetical protein